VKRPMSLLKFLLSGVIAFGLGVPSWATSVKLETSRIFIEYNSSAGDLGFQVSLDAEEWKSFKIINPKGLTIFQVDGKGPYGRLGLSELFFEGAEPTLDTFPLDDLLALFPEGRYQFIGVTTEGTRISGTSTLTHAVPNGPSVSTDVNGENVVIHWEPIPGVPAGFPQERITIGGFQVIAERENPHRELSIDLPATATSVTLPPEFLEPKTHYAFEVLTIETGGNQTITEGSFDTP